MRKTIIALLSVIALVSNFIPAALAAVPAYEKKNTFETAAYSPFASEDDSLTKILEYGRMGKMADDSSMFVRRAQGGTRVRISVNEKIPVTQDNLNYQWNYLKYSFNYLVEGNNNVKTWLGDKDNKTISSEIGSDKMKAGQWNHIDYVVGFHRRKNGSINSNYEIFTYLNGERIGKTGGDIFIDGSTYFECNTTNPLKIEFVDLSSAGFNLYIDDVKLEAYSDTWDSQTTADSLISIPAPAIDQSLANVKNGTVYPYDELSVTDITGARVYSDSTFKTQLTEGTVSVGNVIVAEQDGVIAYYYVTDVPNNYEVILNENFNGGSLGVLKHPYGGNNTYGFAEGLSGKQISDKSVNLKKERTDTPVDCLQFDFIPKANSYLSIDLTFMPTESEQFNELRLNTGGNNLASPIKYDAFHMNRWNKVRYVIFFDEKRDYTTKSYVNGNIYEQGTTIRRASNLANYVRIGVAGKAGAPNEVNTGICTTTYLDDISVTEYVGTEPGADVMPELRAIDGTKTSGTGAVRKFVVGGNVDVSSLTGTNGEAVRAYSYNEQTKTLGDEITVVDAAASQIVVVEGANGAMTYYYVQPAFSIKTKLTDENDVEVGKDTLFPNKYTYTLNAVNNGDDNKDIYIAMGRYDKDGNLKNVAFAKDTIVKNTSNFEKQIFIDLTDVTDLDEENDYIVMFAWDANITPYIAPVSTK